MKKKIRNQCLFSLHISTENGILKCIWVVLNNFTKGTSNLYTIECTVHLKEHARDSNLVFKYTEMCRTKCK